MKMFEEFYADHFNMYDPYGEFGQKRVENLTEFVMRYIDAPKDSLFLDIGCGAGISTLAILHNGYKAVGIDIREDAVELAKKYFRETDVEAELICGDIRKIPFPNDTFDAAAMLFNPLPHWSMSDFWEIASEINRIIKPGGQLLIEFLDIIDTALAGLWKNIIVMSGENGATMHVTSGFNVSEGFVRQTFIDPGTGKSYNLDMQMWSRWLVDFILKKTGFPDIEFKRREHQSTRWVVIAKK